MLSTVFSIRFSLQCNTCIPHRGWLRMSCAAALSADIDTLPYPRDRITAAIPSLAHVASNCWLYSPRRCRSRLYNDIKHAIATRRLLSRPKCLPSTSQAHRCSTHHPEPRHPFHPPANRLRQLPYTRNHRRTFSGGLPHSGRGRETDMGRIEIP